MSERTHRLPRYRLKSFPRLSSLGPIISLVCLGGVGCGSGGPNAVASDPAAFPQHSEPKTDAQVDSIATANEAPHIWSVEFEPANPTGDDAVRVNVDAVDPDGDPLFFEYEWELAGRRLAEVTHSVTLEGASRGSLLAVNVTVSDGVDTARPVRAEVALTNRPPRFERLSIHPSREIYAGMDVTATPEARDPDGDLVQFSYEWRVNGRPAKDHGAVFSTRDLRRGDVLSVAVTASDGESESEPIASPNLTIVNAPPRIVSTPNQPGQDGVFRYQVRAEDPDGDSGLQFHLLDAPDGMKIDTLSGSITWEPQPNQLGTRIVSVVVDDLQGGRGVQNFEVRVNEE